MAKVFISYSKRDYIDEDGQVIQNNVIDKILNVLKDNDISYWIDQKGLDPGDTYAETIAKSIKECDTFLFLSTKNANSSSWTLREISSAIDFEKKILPVKLDHSNYADSVALYLASVQYIDWLELGEAEALHRIVSRINGKSGEAGTRHFDKDKLPKWISALLYFGLILLTGLYACLTYQFLWAKSLRSNEIMGGLVGYVCEFGILLSIYYLIRILRLRRCVFAVPAAVTMITFLFGMLLRDSDVMLSAVLLLSGWLFILAICLIGRNKGKNFFRIMSKDQVILKANDPENLIIVYLIIKAVIIVIAHYMGLSIDDTLASPYLF